MEDEYEEMAQPPQEWAIRSLADAYKPRPRTQWVLEGIFSDGSLNIVYGAPASMKSMLLADLCACIVGGQEWLPGTRANGKGVPVERAPVFWIDMDNGTRRTDQRIDAVGRGHNLIPTDPFHYVSMPQPPLNVMELNMMIYMRDLIRSLQARLVVIDNLGLITGEVEENSAAMAMVMGYLRQIAEYSNAAIVLVHHQRKGGANGGRAGDALRGHSSIEAAVDLALHVIREANSDEVTIRSTKTRGVPVPTLAADFVFNHVADSIDLESAWFRGKSPKIGASAIRETIMEVIDLYGEIAKMKLVNEVRDSLGQDAPGINKIRAWIDDMLATGQGIKEQEKGKYKVIVAA